MANNALIQIRAAEEDKQRAGEILEKLGTNISAVVNMLLKQIILTEGIPFEISLHTEYDDANQRNLREVAATMRLEGMDLDAQDMALLKFYQENPDKGDALRKMIAEELGVKYE